MSDTSLSVLILAGGKSTRMGADKTWLLLNGQPLIEWLARRVTPLAAEILISANNPGPFRPLLAALAVPARVVSDFYPGAGPLAGLQAGLRLAAYELVLMLGVDMPLVNLELLRHMAGLADGYDVVMPWAGTGPAAAGAGESEAAGRLRREPLHAVYRRTCLPAVETQLQAGERRVTSFLPQVRVRDLWPPEIARFDPDFLSFLNANTPAEWEAVQRLCADS